MSVKQCTVSLGYCSHRRFPCGVCSYYPKIDNPATTSSRPREAREGIEIRNLRWYCISVDHRGDSGLSNWKRRPKFDWTSVPAFNGSLYNIDPSTRDFSHSSVRSVHLLCLLAMLLSHLVACLNLLGGSVAAMKVDISIFKGWHYSSLKRRTVFGFLELSPLGGWEGKLHSYLAHVAVSVVTATFSSTCSR